jgi:ubiquinone/menaquinone biosynthesis C-methylase UbiE
MSSFFGRFNPMKSDSPSFSLANNAWLHVPLADYEGHMSEIGQTGMLADQFEAALTTYTPKSVALIGCAGGNGFDRIRSNVVERVIGVDINDEYLSETSRRFAGTIPCLELYHADIANTDLRIDPVELVFAGLIFEFVDLAAAMKMIRTVCGPKGVLVTVLQQPCATMADVSPSPFVSLQRVAGLVRLISPPELEQAARKVGFGTVSMDEIGLSSGKQFSVLTFQTI